MASCRQEIINILRCYLNNDYNYSFDGNFDELYDLSNNLEIGSVIGYTLNKCNIKTKRFDNSIYKSLNKHERLVATAKNIEELFAGKYDFLFLKGLSISKYYEEPYLRHIGDIDIIVKEDNFVDAHSLLTNNGYRFVRSIKEEVTLANSLDIVVDLHHFNKLGEGFKLLLKDQFSDRKELDINYLYVYNLLHCLKHFKLGVLTYRFFIDLFYLRKLIDNDVVDKLLKECDLSLFNTSVNSYLDALITKKEYSENDIQIENFIFNYSVDSGSKNRTLINSYGKTRLTYLLSRLFIPYKLISEEYSILKKHKLLLPFYYVKRIITIAKGYRGKYARDEIESIFSFNTEASKDMQTFLKSIGAESSSNI